MHTGMSEAHGDCTCSGSAAEAEAGPSAQGSEEEWHARYQGEWDPSDTARASGQYAHSRVGMHAPALQ